MRATYKMQRPWQTLFEIQIEEEKNLKETSL
jgi:hypothetical protein